jgi:hypothetical protein
MNVGAIIHFGPNTFCSMEAQSELLRVQQDRVSAAP